MTWSSTAPNGGLTVKANQPILQGNTSYIEMILGNTAIGTNPAALKDHFWNLGSGLSGHHRFIKAPGFTTGTPSVPADPEFIAPIEGVIYLKSDELTAARVQGYYKNASGVYQFIPAYLTGSVSVTSTNTYVTITSIPANCYGEIFMFSDDVSSAKYRIQTGIFRSDATIVQAWSYTNVVGSGSDNSAYALELLNFGTGTPTDLNIKVRRHDAGSGNWTYKITYRAI